MGAIERGRERGRVGDRGTGGSAPAVPAVNLLMHARIHLYLTFSSPLLSLSLSLSNAVIQSCRVINVQLHAMHARRVASTQNAPRYDASWNEHRVGGLSYVRIILSPPASSAA